jgi:hypothetical protein
VILIDALDESLTYTGQITIADLVAQADNLSPDVRFIVTCRPENDLLRTLRGRSARELTLSPGRDDPTGAPVRVLHDVQEYLEQVLSEKKPTLESDLSLPELVTTIRNQSEGNFLYVRHLLRALTTRPEPITHTSLEQLPTGLDQVYLEFLQRLVGKDLDTWHRGHDKVLGVIAVGQVPLTEDLIGHCCVVGSR